MTRDDLRPIRREVSVPAPPALAFAHFVQEIDAWWPRAYTWAGERLANIVIEAREDGRCYETGPHGFRLDWGRVTHYEPPQRLIFTWQIGFDRVPLPDPAQAGEVEVRFAPSRAGQWTAVVLEHRGFAAYANGAAYRAALAGRDGWTHILARYAGYLG